MGVRRLLGGMVSPMTTTRAAKLDELEACLRDGGCLDDVDSTDDHLVLVLSDGEGTRSLELDRDETRQLVETGLLDELTSSGDSTSHRPRIPV